jgi:hypothetical protein
MGDQDKLDAAVEVSRRSFVKKLVAAGFAVPVVSSFALDAAASADVPHGHGDNDVNQEIFLGNQTFGFDEGGRVPHGHGNRYGLSNDSTGIWTGDT